jgi:hypothetical protein
LNGGLPSIPLGETELCGGTNSTGRACAFTRRAATLRLTPPRRLEKNLENHPAIWKAILGEES